MLSPATWTALGYGKVGPRDPTNQSEIVAARLLANAFRDRVGYAIIDDASGVWIRDPARQTGRSPQTAAQIAATIDAASRTDQSKYDSISKLQASEYAKLIAGHAKDVATVRQDLVAFSQGPKSAAGVYHLTLAMATCPTADLLSFLQDDVAPTFFNSFSMGSIVLIPTSYDYERRQGAVRAGYTSSQYGGLQAIQLQDDSFDTLRQWQVITPHLQLRAILDLGALAFFPTVPFFTAIRAGLLTVFIPGELVEHIEPDFPTGWLAVYGSHADFAREPWRASSGMRAAGFSQPYASYRRYVQRTGYSSAEIGDWIEYLIDRANDLLFHASDPTEFITKQGFIDFVTCFEHGLSVDRMLRRGASALASDEVIARKSATMEIADIIDELLSYWDQNAQSTERFKTLFNPTSGLALVTQALTEVPNPMKTDLLAGCKAVYDELRQVIRDSVFVKSKLTAAGVLVRNRTLSNETEENQDEFTANVVRALRNTHHGYMTELDKQARPSRYLALVNGAVPDTISYLGLLFVLAYVADPATLTGRVDQPIGQHP